jgi:hypothetical protein
MRAVRITKAEAAHGLLAHFVRIGTPVRNSRKRTCRRCNRQLKRFGRQSHPEALSSGLCVRHWREEQDDTPTWLEAEEL